MPLLHTRFSFAMLFCLGFGIQAIGNEVRLMSGYQPNSSELNSNKLTQALGILINQEHTNDTSLGLLADYALLTNQNLLALRFSILSYNSAIAENKPSNQQYLATLRYSASLEAINDFTAAINLWIKFMQRMELNARHDLAMAGLAQLTRVLMLNNEFERAGRFLQTIDSLYLLTLPPAIQFEVNLQKLNLAINQKKFFLSDYELLAAKVLNEKSLQTQHNLLRLIDLSFASDFNDKTLATTKWLAAKLLELLNEKNQLPSPSIAILIGKRSDDLQRIADPAELSRCLILLSDAKSKLEEEMKMSIDQSLSLQKSQKQQADIINISGWLIVLLIVLLFAYVHYRILNQFNIQKTSLVKTLSAKEDEIKHLAEAEGNTEDLISQKVTERIDAIKSELEMRKQIDQELQRALDEAERANYLKNAFLSNLSHEIRTPLNGILGFSSLLQNEFALNNMPELYDYAQMIERSGERLLHLLNNIIDISRLEANDFQIRQEPCSLKNCLEPVINNFKPKALEKGLKIYTDLTNCSLIADPNTLPRVFSEFIDNALNYTEKGFIKINAKQLPNEQKVEICIQDTGVGIDPAYLNQIFDPYRQESLGYSRQYQGAGLGIPLAKRLVERMEGELTIKSEKAVGTSVILSFKLSPTNDTLLNNNVGGATVLPTAFKHALIVEDDASSRIILEKILEKHIQTVSTNDGETCLRRIEEAAQRGIIFDLILMDINLPAPWDGKKLKDHIIKHFPEYQKATFIAQTAYAMEGDKERFIEAGFNAYLSKPISRSEVLQLIGLTSS